MFNPFSVFEPRFLPAFRKKGVKAFVLQRYDRGRNMLEEPPRPAFVLFHFNSVLEAENHFNAIESDREQRLFRLENPEDLQALESLLSSGNAHYYTALTVKNLNEKARLHLNKKIHAYIDKRTKWKPGRDQQVGFNLVIESGKILVRLKFGSHEQKIELDELEKLSYVL